MGKAVHLPHRLEKLDILSTDDTQGGVITPVLPDTRAMGNTQGMSIIRKLVATIFPLTGKRALRKRHDRTLKETQNVFIHSERNSPPPFFQQGRRKTRIPCCNTRRHTQAPAGTPSWAHTRTKSRKSSNPGHSERKRETGTHSDQQAECCHVIGSRT